MEGISHMHPRARCTQLGKVCRRRSSWIAVGGKPGGGGPILNSLIGQSLPINVEKVNAQRTNHRSDQTLSAAKDSDTLSGESGKVRQ